MKQREKPCYLVADVAAASEEGCWRNANEVKRERKGETAPLFCFGEKAERSRE